MWLRRPAEPRELDVAKARLNDEAAHFWKQKKKRARPPDPDPVLQSAEILDPLLLMTNENCAYCERGLEADGPNSPVIAHHRPTWGAVGTAGDIAVEAYWWLTYEWENLFPACADCVRSRGSRFPVIGDRATRSSSLLKERPLLLDPIVDDPDEHLRYHPDGTVTALTERGRMTSDILALNRNSLVKDRLGVLDGVADDASFPTLRRQLAIPTPSPTESLTPAPTLRPVGPDLPQISLTEPGPPAYDLNVNLVGSERDHYFQATQWIERVVIKNFRPIRDLDIDLARSTSERGPWTVLLGENGCGKSSILHAIALTMMGGEQRRLLGIDARNYLRHGARKGLVQVFLSGRPDPLELQ